LSVEAWRDRLGALLADPGRLDDAAEFRRRWVREHYAWDRVGPELDRHYRRVIAEHTRG
jgi:hypothetical protein